MVRVCLVVCVTVCVPLRVCVPVCVCGCLCVPGVWVGGWWGPWILRGLPMMVCCGMAPGTLRPRTRADTAHATACHAGYKYDGHGANQPGWDKLQLVVSERGALQDAALALPAAAIAVVQL